MYYIHPPEKIRFRTMDPEKYVDEMGFDLYRPLVQWSPTDTVNQRHLMIAKHWWKQDRFPEY